MEPAAVGKPVAQLQREVRDVDEHMRRLNAECGRLTRAGAQTATTSGAQQQHGGAVVRTALGVLKERLDARRADRRACKAEFAAAKREVGVLEAKRKEKLAPLQQMKRNSDMCYTDRDKLQSTMDKLRKSFQMRTCSTLREEQTFVSELDKLERNMKLLDKYVPAQFEFDSINASLKGAREAKQQLYFRMRRLTGDIDKLAEERRKLDTSLREMKREHWELLRRRKALVDMLRAAFDRRKKEHAAVRDRSDSHDSHASSDPSAFGDALLPLEAFVLEKQHCSALLAYVNALRAATIVHEHHQQQLPNLAKTPSYAAVVKGGGAIASSNESLDNAGGDEAAGGGGDTSPTRRSRKKLGRKSTKRPDKAIVHDVHKLSAFDYVSVVAPKTYGELGACAEQLEELFAHYDQLSTWAAQAAGDLDSVYGGDVATNDSGACGNSSTTMSDLSLAGSMASVGSARSPPNELEAMLGGLSLARSQSAVDFQLPNSSPSSRHKTSTGSPKQHAAGVTSPLAAPVADGERRRLPFCPQRMSAGGDLAMLRGAPPVTAVGHAARNADSGENVCLAVDEGIETSGDGSKDNSPHVSLSAHGGAQQETTAADSAQPDNERSAGVRSPPVRMSSGIDSHMDDEEEKEGDRGAVHQCE